MVNCTQIFNFFKMLKNGVKNTVFCCCCIYKKVNDIDKMIRII